MKKADTKTHAGHSNKPLLSLCIPTNGVAQWMFPTLESIYMQGVDENIFEVVITDNGDNKDFENQMRSYCLRHGNIIYDKTDALPFINEIEAYKRASGMFVKYLNHRTSLMEGTLSEYIRFVQDNIEEKPAVYFSNGVLRGKKDIRVLRSFDEYIKELSYYSSWSTGMAFWKEDFDTIDFRGFVNVLFPHTKVLFHDRQKKRYIVDNRVLLHEQSSGTIPKARYDLFFAFAVDYPALILDLYREQSITAKTFVSVKQDTLRFIAEQYMDYIILKKPCSYDLEGFSSTLQVFYTKSQFQNAMVAFLLRRAGQKLGRIAVRMKLSGKER